MRLHVSRLLQSVYLKGYRWSVLFAWTRPLRWNVWHGRTVCNAHRIWIWSLGRLTVELWCKSAGAF
jgi:hypothetical protein